MESSEHEIEMLDMNQNQYHQLKPNSQDTHRFEYSTALYDFVKIMIPSALGMLIRNLIVIVNWIFIQAECIILIIQQAQALGCFLLLCFIDLQLLDLAEGSIPYAHKHSEQNNYYLAGVFYNSSIISITVLFLVEILIFVNSENILLLVGQPKASAKYAALTIIAILPGLYFK